MDDDLLAKMGIRFHQDTYYQANANDTRKAPLTLKHLNKLRKLRSIRALEKEKRKNVLKTMYGNPKEDDGGGGGMF